MDPEEEVKDEEIITQAGNNLSNVSSAVISIVVFSLYTTVNQWNTGTNVIICLVLGLIFFTVIQPRLRHVQFLQQDGGFGLGWILDRILLFAILIAVFLLVQLLSPKPTPYLSQHPAEAASNLLVTIAVGAFLILTIYNDIQIISLKGERFLGFGVTIPSDKKTN
jgi:hypothetical protein